MAGYQDLKVWQLSIELVLQTYRVTQPFPREELFGLTSQMRRAAVSIPSNIAEGHARRTPREFSRFLNIAKGSLAELETQLVIARELHLCSARIADEITVLTSQISRMLSGLLRRINEAAND
ncbi:MAG: four helix bundle protein [Pirellulales bacterium]|nr:four helix bundle protein [Pirellulales bacterium]